MLSDLGPFSLFLIIIALYQFAPVVVITLGGTFVAERLFRIPAANRLPKPSQGEMIGIAIPFALSVIWWILNLIWSPKVILWLL